MDEDIEVTPMTRVGDVLEPIIERLDRYRFTEDPCEACHGTGTELITIDGITTARVCRHIG